ncbi:hypothetical protein ABZT43_35530 [Streptomyces sp. NPDC005349]|uniref:hypothetical protein n=1 Tax=Streptomyces sp. NPDC005349 TaxID=3157037 RepID=UPI0033BDC623
MPAVVLGRVLQGGLGALVTAAALAMVATGFTGPRERVRTFGVYAVVSVGGPVLGLLTGGSLPACPILGFNLVFALVALVASACCRTTAPVDRTDTNAGTPFDLRARCAARLPRASRPHLRPHPGPVVDRLGRPAGGRRARYRPRPAHLAVAAEPDIEPATVAVRP